MTRNPSYKTGDDRLPGDPEPEEQIARMLRVDHAGEFGAARIYAGQLSVLGKTDVGPTIQHMADQETKHLETFDRLLVERRVRPTILSPLWHMAGFALGARKSAGPCVVSVSRCRSPERNRHRFP